MIARAKAKYIRISPRKFRQIIPLVRGKKVEEAIAILEGTNKRASIYAMDILQSALSNAKRLHEDLELSNVIVSRLTADCGPTLKRYRAASMGRAVMIRKRTSHITVELDELEAPLSDQGAGHAKRQPKKRARSAGTIAQPQKTKESKGAKKVFKLAKK